MFMGKCLKLGGQLRDCLRRQFKTSIFIVISVTMIATANLFKSKKSNISGQDVKVFKLAGKLGQIVLFTIHSSLQ